MVEVPVEADKEPHVGEVLIFTAGGTFCVKGSLHDVAQRVAAEEWPSFELAEKGDPILISSGQVIAMREGTKQAPRRGHIGFAPR